MNIFEIVYEIIRSLSYLLCEMIYSLIIWVYNIFERLCNSRILDSDIMRIISERIGILLGIIMLFMVVFSVIQMVLEPDKLTDKEKGIGNIAKKIILVVVMLGVSDFAFNMLYGVQKKLIDSNIIQKFLLPYEFDEDVDFGRVLSANLFFSFYNFNTEGLNMDNVTGWELSDKQCYNSYYILQTNIMNGEGFSLGSKCINIKSSSVDDYIISFNWVISPIVGVVTLYFIFSYCLSVGMRTIQLAFLEIISPMAIVSYLSPKKENMFQKWTKIYFATYIDVFLRIAIINLVVFLIKTLFENTGEWEFWNSVGQTGDFSDTVILVLMVMALLMFAKKAPDLIKELFPSGASKLGLGIISPKKLLSSMAGEDLIKRGWGAVSVGTGRAIGNTRRAIGKFVATSPNHNVLKRENKALLNGLNEAIESGDDVAEAMIRGQLAENTAALEKSKLDRRKWMIRGFTGLAGGLTGGAMAGLGTKDKGSRDRQIKLGTDRTKSNWKLQDAGYGYKERLEDAGRRVLFMDTDLEQRAESMDAYVSNLEMQINELLRDVQNNPRTPSGEIREIRNVQKAKVPGDGGEYVLYKNGVEQRISFGELNADEQAYVKLLEEKGKAKSNSSALHQRDNEKKEK